MMPTHLVLCAAASLRDPDTVETAARVVEIRRRLGELTLRLAALRAGLPVGQEDVGRAEMRARTARAHADAAQVRADQAAIALATWDPDRLSRGSADWAPSSSR